MDVGCVVQSEVYATVNATVNATKVINKRISFCAPTVRYGTNRTRSPDTTDLGSGSAFLVSRFPDSAGPTEANEKE
jgi:hypothetical protein